jgi:hypothetical protein
MKTAAKTLLLITGLTSGACQSDAYPYQVGPDGFAFHSQVFWNENYPIQVVAGDFDNDGFDDLWIIRDGEQGSILSCRWGGIVSQLSMDYFQPLDVDDACAGDFDGDGHLDLLLFGENSANRIAHYSTLGTRSLRPIGIHLGPEDHAQHLVVSDSNQDGINEVFVHNSAGRSTVQVSWRNNAQPMILQLPWDYQWDQGYGREAVPELRGASENINAIGDLDQDGIKDVLVNSSALTASAIEEQSESQRMLPWDWLGLHALLLDDSGPKLEIKRKLQVLEYMASPHYAVMLDFDGDGDLDIAVKSPRVGESGGVVFIENELSEMPQRAATD